MDVESFASGYVTFENGASLNFKVSWAANLKEENNIIVSGKKCGIDIENKKVTSANRSDDLIVTPNGFSTEAFYGHFCIIKNMADVLLRGAKPCIQPSETLNVTSIIEAAYLSAEKGGPINICEL
jgi:predicted dehydrogenase